MMRRYLVPIAIFAVLLLGGCTASKKAYSEVSSLPIAVNLENDGSNDTTPADALEDNINDETVEKDLEITEKLEKSSCTEEQLLVEQSTAEACRESLEQLQQTIVKEYKTVLPEAMDIALKYEMYHLVSYDYLLILSDGVNVREKPGTNSKVLKTVPAYTKLSLLHEIQGQYIEGAKSDIWYRVFWKENDQVQYGYVINRLGEPRRFQFDKMLASIETLKQKIEDGTMGFVSNQRNRNGSPPAYNGKNQDVFGNERYQSAPGYAQPSDASDFRYIPDGTLVSVTGEKNGFYEVGITGVDGIFWIPQKYVSFKNVPEALSQVIAVDRRNQNEGVFEYTEGRWRLISYTFATTGVKAKYKYETPLGYFMAIEKKPSFKYVEDGTTNIAGYAPYAIRFSGGGFIHGVPVDYKKENGKLVDPGMREYLATIGSTPRSHKCVRNYTSHAKFLYDWIEIGKSAVIVIE